jgi:hypothetical protein
VLVFDQGDSERRILELISSSARERFDGRRWAAYCQRVRLIRTDSWDHATRGEWEDIKRWGRIAVVTGAFVVVYLIARLVTSSYLEQLGIAAGVGAIVGVLSGKLEKHRSQIEIAEDSSDPLT